MLILVYTVLLIAGLPVFIGGVYLFVLTVEAFLNKERRNISGEFKGERSAQNSFLIMIPAHNEALLLGKVLEELKGSSYPEELRKVLVIADNCDDATADIARAAGVDVVERFNDEERGKGQALNWAIRSVLPDYDCNAVVVMDADSTMNNDFLWFMDEKLKSGFSVCQAYYRVQNPKDSWRTSLMEIAFAAFHFLRSLGRMRLNASCGLKGNGMCFQRELLDKYGYPAFSVVEDVELAMFYLTKGIKVEFVPGAHVAGQMVSNSSDSDTQRRRWEGGRFALIRQWCPKLFKTFAKEKKFAYFDGMMELLVPPFSILVCLGVVGSGFSLMLPLPEVSYFGAMIKSLWLVSCMVFAVYIFSGMILIKARPYLYGRLFFAPIYVGWKMATYLKMICTKILKREKSEWVRTGRHDSDSNEIEILMVMGLPFHNVTFKSCVDWSVERMKSGIATHICTANMDFVTRARKDREFQRVIFESDMVIADGVPIVKMSKFEGPALKERVTGSDISPMLAEACRDNDLSVFGLGAAPGVADKAMKILQERYPGLRVAGAFSPPKADILDMPHDEIKKMISDADTNLVLTAFGAPKQDKWGRLNVGLLNKPLLIGIGGTLDFIAGIQTRAPRFVQKINMEWLWRLGTNPKRLFKRYAENIIFFGYVIIQQFIMKHAPWLSTQCTRIDCNIEQMQNTTLITYDDIKSAEQKQIDVLKRLESRISGGNVVVDLQNRDWLNSVELGTLAVLCAQCHKTFTLFAMINVSERVRHYFSFYNLTEYFKIAKTSDELSDMVNDYNARRKEVEIVRNNGELKIVLPFELTVHNAYQLDSVVEEIAADESLKVTVDDSCCEFMDTAGRLRIHRLQTMTA